ncbi:MAG TPA: rod shape-determining protein MreC [Acidobacteriota bacterium]|nr:rod shape-determining protein MreC [Acidobacteriota bacterium]
MREIRRRTPFLPFVLLALLHILLISIQVRSPEGRTFLHSAGVLALTPLAASADFVADFAGRLFSRYVFLLRTEEENQRLRAELARLKVENAALEGMRAMLERSRSHDLLRLQFQFDLLPVGIIWKSPPFFANRVIINAGSLAGVRKDAAVITPDGAVGRIFAITPFSSEVELLTNPNAAAGVVMGDSGLQGVAQGSGGGLLQVSFIPNTEAVETGALVYTSGADRIYPKSIPVGRVVRSERGSVYREILVQPAVDFSRVQEVLVVLPERQ